MYQCTHLEVRFDAAIKVWFWQHGFGDLTREVNAWSQDQPTDPKHPNCVESQVIQVVLLLKQTLDVGPRFHSHFEGERCKDFLPHPGIHDPT